MVSFPLSKDALLIGLAGSDQTVEDSRQLMSRGGNGFRSAKLGAHAPVVVAQNRLVVMQRMSGDAQRKRVAVLDVAGAHGQYLATADAVIGAEAQP